MNKMPFPKFTIMAILVSVFCMMISTANAQFGEKIWDRTVQKTKREADQRSTKAADRTIDKGFDKVEGVFKKKKKNEGGEDEFETMDDDDFMTTDTYEEGEPFKSDFVGTFEMEYEVYEKGQRQNTIDKAKYYFNKNKIAVEMTAEGKNSRIIWDHDANTLALVNPDKRTATVMKQQKIGASTSSDEDFEVTRDGDTKFVLGRKCVKYTAVSDDGIATLWVDESVRFDYQESMRGMTGDKARIKGTKSGYMNQIAGFPIEVEYISGADKVITRTTLLNIGTVSEHAFDLSGLDVQDLSAFQN